MLLAAIPILLELFTSEGCSSCPPADALLAKLQRAQPYADAQLVVLSEHVDYWNDLGWQDPYSSAQFTARQSRYGLRVYTPQAVIDGRVDAVGSDEAAIATAVKGAMSDPHGVIKLGGSARLLTIAVTALPAHKDAEVLLALVEDGLTSVVARGENQGRTLHHTAVVRSLRTLGEAAGPAWSGEVALEEDARLRPVVFVQERASHKVLATALREPRPKAP